jgi:hypothetical protein
MDEEELKKHLEEINKIHIDLIAAYNHEIQSKIGVDLQQLLVMLYFHRDDSGHRDDFIQRIIQEYCYTLLSRYNLLWEGHRGDYHKIKHLENSKLHC